jgi:REP element-mobilizing transposase RayT
MHNRKLPRLQNFDYSSARIYFVTINCHDNLHLLGEIEQEGEENIFKPSTIGAIAAMSIDEIPSYYPGVEILDYVIMPNHIHILISLLESEGNINLSKIIGALKSIVTRKTQTNYPEIKLWKKSFNDHIIRNERDYLIHGEYVKANVQRWRKDEYF